MKERSLLYFLTAVVASVLFLVALIIRFFPWFNSYGSMALPTLHKLIFPLALLWIGWYFENKGFLISATILSTVLLMFHMDYSGLLNGDIFIVSSYAPLVRTTYVLGFILLLGSNVLGYYTYLKMKLDENKS